MKRILLLIFIFASVSLSAQVWTSHHIAADELMGRTESTELRFTKGGCTFSYTVGDNEHFYLATPYVLNAQFDGRWYCKVKVGLYDASDKMLESLDMYLKTSEDLQDLYTFPGGKMSVPVGQHRNARKIISHLHTVGGYVRFLVPTYSNGTLDIRVKCHE